jgi:hypothetical protein
MCWVGQWGCCPGSHAWTLQQLCCRREHWGWNARCWMGALANGECGASVHINCWHSLAVAVLRHKAALEGLYSDLFNERDM